MKVSLVQSGGIAGIRRVATLDSGALPPEQARALEQLVERADFFGLPDKIEAAVRGADRFQYALTVETHERQHTVRVSDGAVPRALAPLLERLRQAAQPQPIVPATAKAKRRRAAR